MKKIILLLAVIVLVIITVFVLGKPVPLDYKQITYQIDGRSVTLQEGSDTRYFGNEVKADLNFDGEEDVAFIITHDGGGTGVFYYLVAALKEIGGYASTNAIFLGDRIAPQTTEFREGKIIVNYADRRPDEPMSAQPSVGFSSYFQLKDGVLTKS